MSEDSIKDFGIFHPSYGGKMINRSDFPKYLKDGYVHVPPKMAVGHSEGDVSIVDLDVPEPPPPVKKKRKSRAKPKPTEDE